MHLHPVWFNGCILKPYSYSFFNPGRELPGRAGARASRDRVRPDNAVASEALAWLAVQQQRCHHPRVESRLVKFARVAGEEFG